MIQDLRFAVRMLARNPGFASLAVAALALGIGANTAVFSVVDGVVLRPLRFERPEQLARIFVENPAEGRLRYDVSPADFVSWKNGSRGFEGLAAVAGRGSAAVAAVSAWRVEPHSPQNLATAGLAVPHTAQITPSREPHSAQNLRPASFEVPHTLQTTGARSMELRPYRNAVPRGTGPSAPYCRERSAVLGQGYAPTPLPD